MTRYHSIELPLAFLAVLFLPVSAFAASIITLSVLDDGVFQLLEANMEKAAVIDITISL
jgi:hypothetical protein